MGAVHRRAVSSPETMLSAVARATGLSHLPPLPRPEAVSPPLDLGFATAVPTDDDSADDDLDSSPNTTDTTTSPGAPKDAPAPTPATSSASAGLRRRPRRSSAASTSSAASYLPGNPLDYLDLPPSIPLALAQFKDSVSAHLSALEARLSGWTESEKLHAHLAAARDQLRMVLNRVPPEGVVSKMSDVSAEVGARLTSLKAHLDAATEQVGGEWNNELDALCQRTAQATKMLEMRMGEWTAGAWDAVSRAKDQAESLEQRLYTAALDLAAEGRRLITYADLPELWRNNEYILTGYRFIPVRHWPKLLASTFQWHNETLNVWLHLLGIALVLCSPYLFPVPYSGLPGSETTAMDKIISWVYMAAAVECLVFSVTWHVMAGCSDSGVFTLFACVDYTGIAWLIAASIWSVEYSLFWFQPNLIWAYVALTGVLAIACTIVLHQQSIGKQCRIMLFVALAGSGALPMAHAAWAHGIYKTAVHLLPIVPSLFAYMAGLVFYSTHFPEVRWPGKFDFVGHAHQIWHLSIVVAILLHYRCVQEWHASRANYADPSSTVPSSATPSGAAGTAATLLATEAAKFIPLNVPAYKDDQALLTAADEAVHGFKVSLGEMAGGAVGRLYNSLVDYVKDRLG